MALWFEIAHDVVDEHGTVLGAAVDHRERGCSHWYAELVTGEMIGSAPNRAAASALVSMHYALRFAVAL